jgi:hypothetical protein
MTLPAKITACLSSDEALRGMGEIDVHLEELCLLFDKKPDRGLIVGICMLVLLLEIGKHEGRKALDFVHRNWRFAQTGLGAKKT